MVYFGIQVHPQHSCDLAGSLHRVGCPEPVLPVHYHRNERRADFSPSPKIISRDFGIVKLLDDPVFGEQACAAFLCTKFVNILYQNIPCLSDSRKNNTLKFLKFIDEFTSEALTSVRQTEVLRNALEEAVKTVEGLTGDASEIKELFSGKRLRRLRLKTQFPLTAHLWSELRIPFSEAEAKALSKYLGLDKEASTETNSESSNLPHLSCALDPFLIALSARRVNPDFLGSGCLRIIGNGNPLMLWAPPISSNSLTTSTPKIFLSSFSNTDSFPLSTSQYTSFQLPDDFVGSSICEVDAVQVSHSKSPSR